MRRVGRSPCFLFPDATPGEHPDKRRDDAKPCGLEPYGSLHAPPPPWPNLLSGDPRRCLLVSFCNLKETRTKPPPVAYHPRRMAAGGFLPIGARNGKLYSGGNMGQG